MNKDRLTDELARRMGWRLAPGRYLQPERRWIPTRRFNPFNNSDHAFQVASKLADRFIVASAGCTITAEVAIGKRVARASCDTVSRALTTALAHALGLIGDGGR